MSRTIDLGEGRDGALTVAMEVDVGPAVVAVTAPPTSAAAAPTGSILKPIGIGALAVGGAGLLLGGITGGLAIARHGDLTTECKPTCNTSSSQSDLSSYHTLGALSTAGFVIGAVGLGSGLTLLLLAPRSDAKASAGVWPYVGPSGAGAAGRF